MKPESVFVTGNLHHNSTFTHLRHLMGVGKGGCEISDILFGLMNLEEDSGNIENVHDWKEKLKLIFWS